MTVKIGALSAIPTYLSVIFGVNIPYVFLRPNYRCPVTETKALGKWYHTIRELAPSLHRDGTDAPISP